MTQRLPVRALDATGTPSSTTYLRGDGAWGTPAGGSGAATPYAETPVLLTVGMFSSPEGGLTDAAKLCDGIVTPDTTNMYTTIATWGVGTQGVREHLVCDLGANYTLSRIQVTPLYWDNRSYNNVRIETSTDGTTWTTRLDSTGARRATSEGYAAIIQSGVAARYIRYSTTGNNQNGGKHAVEMLAWERHGGAPADGPATWQVDPADPTVMIVTPGQGVSVDPADSSVLVVTS